MENIFTRWKKLEEFKYIKGKLKKIIKVGMLMVIENTFNIL